MATSGKPNLAPTPKESASLRRWAALRAAYFEQFHTIELKTAAASERVVPLAQRYVEALREDLTRSTALIAEAGPLQAERVKARATREFIYVYPTGISGKTVPPGPVDTTIAEAQSRA